MANMASVGTFGWFLVVDPSAGAFTPLQVDLVLDETVSKIQALSLGGAGVAEVFKGRYPKPQAKKISINVYPGDVDQTRRASGTNHQFLELPVHIRIQFKRTDKIQGPEQAETIFEYMDQIQQALHLQRPEDLSQSISYFWLTEVDWDDTDTETGRGTSVGKGVDSTIEGHLTVRWQFWRNL